MLTRMDRRIVACYRALEQKLCERYPEACREAELLAKRVTNPKTADTDKVWAIAWNKPLYAHTRVEIGKNWAEKLELHTAGAWRQWGREGDEFCIVKIGKGTGTEAFKAVGLLAKQIRDETRIPKYRLFAIQGAAAALRMRAAQSKTPYANLIGVDLSDVVPTVQREMGFGWGHITVLHFLAAMGLGCKPDPHLVKTARCLWPELKLKEHGIPTLKESVEINRKVRSLVEALDGCVKPARLRYIDKILMEISYRKLINRRCADPQK